MSVVASPVASPMQAQPEGGEGTSLGSQPVADSEAMAMAALRAAAERVHRLAMQQEPQESELSEELLVYRPQGERDAVVVTDKDMEGLQPTKFISNNIVDFYVRYLEFKLPIEVQNCVYFFNSFFFRKLESSTTFICITRCKVNYGQVKEWSKGINLFEKDYVFIPILKSSHWSLVIICHLKSLTRSPDEMTRSPCILHLDPIEGQHESSKDVIRSYLVEAWRERFDPVETVDQIVALCQMKYVQAKVPLQKNFYDCGLYVLNYIEAFLWELSSPYSSVAVSESVPHFTSYDFQRWTLERISLTRSYIQNLILERSRVYQERVRKRRTIMNLTDELLQISQKLWTCLEDQGPSGGCVKDVQTGGPSVLWNGEESEMKPASTHEDAMDVARQYRPCIPPFELEAVQVPEIEHAEYREGNEGFSDKLQHREPDETPHVVSSSAPPQGSNKRGRVWNEEETAVLLECKAKGGRFCKGGRGGADWKLICTEIGMKSGNMPTREQCRRRYDTLKKAFETCKKYCLKNGKTFGEITDEERVELRLATKLREEWYTAIDEICEKAKSPKRIKVNSNRGLGLHPSGLLDASAPNALAISTGRALDDGAAKVESGRRIGGDMPHDDFQGFSTLSKDLQATLVYLVQVRTRAYSVDLDLACRRLAILQGCEPGEIMKHVSKLWEFNFVRVNGMVFEEELVSTLFHFWKWRELSFAPGVHKEISAEVLRKNPHLRTYFRAFPVKRSSLQYVGVLDLYCRTELTHLDLRTFPNLRALSIRSCPNLNSVTGWDAAARLGSLDIEHCYSYGDFPDVQYLSSLREFSVSGRTSENSAIPWQLSQLSPCVKLRRLEITRDDSFSESVDLDPLKDLKFLESLSLRFCDFPALQGLSGLQGLTELRLQYCSRLRSVPGLGCLKGLTALSFSCSGVEDIAGVEELHLLTALDLSGCDSLNGDSRQRALDQFIRLWT